MKAIESSEIDSYDMILIKPNESRWLEIEVLTISEALFVLSKTQKVSSKTRRIYQKPNILFEHSNQQIILFAATFHNSLLFLVFLGFKEYK